MIIGGFQKFSLIDFPGKTCATIFTQGCNFRCRYCHNPELCTTKSEKTIPLIDVYDFLASRVGLLDAVTITGGEPTLHHDLLEVMRTIKTMGFLIKLDSNGSSPAVLELAIAEGLVDYLAMDIKAPLNKEAYAKIIGRPIATAHLEKSMRLIINSGIDYEFRTTVAQSLTTKNDLRTIAQTLDGAKNYYLHRFVPAVKMNDTSLMNDSSYSERELHELAQEFKKNVKNCSIR